MDSIFYYELQCFVHLKYDRNSVDNFASCGVVSPHDAFHMLVLFILILIFND